MWASDSEKIKRYVQGRFPKMETDPNQRKMAARTVRLIYLYYVEGSTAAQVAEALGMTKPAVDMMIHRLNKTIANPRPVGRPKKSVSIHETSGEQATTAILPTDGSRLTG